MPLPTEVHHAAALATLLGAHACAHFCVRPNRIPDGRRLAVVRWYFMHVLVNVLIAGVTAPAAFRLPVAHVRECTPIAATQHGSSPFPIVLAVWLHVYHACFFPLSRADWLHHGVFVSLLGVPGVLYDFGACGNAQLFFLCGLPGAVVYALTVAKHYFRSVGAYEPAVSLLLNLIMRAPGALCAQYRLALAWRAGVLDPPTWTIVAQLVLGPTNAVYYAAEAWVRASKRPVTVGVAVGEPPSATPETPEWPTSDQVASTLETGRAASPDTLRCVRVDASRGKDAKQA